MLGFDFWPSPTRGATPPVDAVLAVGLHLLNLVQERFLLAIVTSLLALLLFRDLREETATQELAQSVANTERRWTKSGRR